VGAHASTPDGARQLRGLWRAVVAFAVLLAVPCATRAERLELAIEQTRIVFHLDSTLHRIEGSARLASGELEFSPEGGLVQGRIVIDARSLETGNGLRDRAMHAKVLESERFPHVELLPTTLEVASSHDGAQAVVLGGEIHIHGAKHALEIRAQVVMRGDEAHIRASFQIPHVAWGMRDMSNLLLRVDKQVTVEIDAVGRIVHDGGAHSSQRRPQARAPIRLACRLDRAVRPESLRDDEGAWQRWLGPPGRRVLYVRPDRFVVADLAASEASDALRRLLRPYLQPAP